VRKDNETLALDLGDSRIALLSTHAPALLAFVRFVRMGTPRGSVMNEQARLLLALVDGGASANVELPAGVETPGAGIRARGEGGVAAGAEPHA
jgi:hypothetical protein